MEKKKKNTCVFIFLFFVVNSRTCTLRAREIRSNTDHCCEMAVMCVLELALNLPSDSRSLQGLLFIIL